MNTKKMLSVVLALVMVFSLSVTAFAAHPEPSMCDTCGQTYSGTPSSSTHIDYTEYFNVDAIEGCESSGGRVYLPAIEGKNIACVSNENGELCFDCLTALVNEYKASHVVPAYSTSVSYAGTGTESYTVTVPATITVKDTGDKATGEVNVAGTWASNKHLTVTCPTTVTLTNSINSADTKTLNITFAGIDKTGNNCEAIKTTDTGAHATLTIANIDKALFGTWTGSISYTVTMATVAN